MTIIITIDEKTVHFAVLFRKVDINALDFPVLLPIRPMIGIPEEGRETFTELVSGAKYLNFYNEWETPINEGFECMDSLENVVKLSGKTDYMAAMNEMWRQVEGNVFFYGCQTLDSDPVLAMMSIEDFYHEFGVEFKRLSTDESNNLLNSYVSGEITSIEYQKKLSKRPGNIINLLDYKD